MAQTPLLDAVAQLRFADVDWSMDDRPVLIADGTVHRIDELDAVIEADAAYVVGVNQKSFDHAATELGVIR